MADFVTMAVVHLLVRLEVVMLGFLTTNDGKESVEALLIIGVLLLVPAAILIILIKAGDLAGNKIATFVTAGLAIAAGE